MLNAHFAALQDLVEEGRIAQPVVRQVKQKFGQLVVYLGNATLETLALAEALRLKSAVTCEGCGSPGLLRWYAGVKTLCDEHAPFGTPWSGPNLCWKNTMSPDLAALLYSRYPAIFAQRHLSMRESLMCLGFSCGDGWFTIIDDLCAKLQAGVERADFPQPEAVQVKEKFAELRFYYRPYGEAADAIVEKARVRSRTTCEICGEPGVLRELGGWYRTRCDSHADSGSSIVGDADPGAASR